MQDKITDIEVIAALLLPVDPGNVGKRDVDYMLALAKMVMTECQEGDNDDPVGEEDTPSYAAVQQASDVALV